MTDALLTRIADALDRLAPPPVGVADLSGADAFEWAGADRGLVPVQVVSALPMHLLLGIDQAKRILLDNTRRFADGFAANNALLWGARGTGKSSLVKAVHAHLIGKGASLKIVEIHREDLGDIGALLDHLRDVPDRVLLYCDDLSFEPGDAQYKSLKAVLDGGLAGRPPHILFYATSNRRHLMPRDMMENERSTAITPGEAVEESVSLSDRFGLWLGFHPCSQDVFLEMITGYCDHFGLAIAPDVLRAEAVEWYTTRGSRSGRVAWQFFLDLAGRHGVTIAV